MKLTKKKQELYTLIKNAVADTNAEQYKMWQGLYVCTNNQDYSEYNAVYFSPRIVKALLKKGLVQYSWANYPNTVSQYNKNQNIHCLVPRGFEHPVFGWKVGDIGKKGHCFRNYQYGVCIAIDKGVLTFKPLNSDSSRTFSLMAANEEKCTIEEALEFIKAQAIAIPNENA